MDAPVISAVALTKRYGRTLALSDLTLEVQPGEIFGFLGPNGAGKTTTIRLLLDLIRPTAGSARILGLDAHADAVALKHRIGYVPGELRLYERMTGRDLLTFSMRLRAHTDTGLIEALTERFRCTMDAPIGSLSHGNRQKVGIVLALAHDPELLILDEPTQGLDPLMQHEFATLLRELRAQGRTVFLSSHDLAEVGSVCDRVGMIRVGQMIAVERIEDLKRRAARELELRFESPPPIDAFRNVVDVRDLRVDGTLLHCIVTGSPDAILKAASRFTIAAITSHEPNLEDVFLARYDDHEVPHVA